MKRARLTVAPAPPKAEAADLTDRLLARESKPKPRTMKRARKPNPSPLSSSQSVDSPSPALLESALVQSRAALVALREASSHSPSRYDVALRYRLDALAHHLQQVAEFAALAAGRRSEP